MQRDAVAFAVEDERPAPVGGDRMGRGQHRPAVLRDCRLRFVESTVAIEIDQEPVIAGPVVVGDYQTSASGLAFKRQDAEHKLRGFVLVDFTTEDGGVEPDRTVEIDAGNVEPDDLFVVWRCSNGSPDREKQVATADDLATNMATRSQWMEN